MCSNLRHCVPLALILILGLTFASTAACQLQSRFCRFPARFNPLEIQAVDNFALGVGDLDGDGDVDLVTSDIDFFPVSQVYFNDGIGNFSKVNEFFLLANSIQIADLNSDGLGDLVLSGVGARVLFNEDGASFADSRSYGANVYNQIKLGDIDNDGDLDIVGAGDTDLIGVLINQGNGVFDMEVEIPANDTSRIQLGDFNSDGILDIAGVGEEITIHLHDGNFIFTTSDEFSSGIEITDAKTADLDSDGDLDFVVFRSEANSFAVFTNNGKGEFSGPTEYRTEPFSSGIQIIDLDVDSTPEIVVNHTALFGGTFTYGFHSIFANNRKGTFALHSFVPIPSGVNNTAAADIDGDSDTDLIVQFDQGISIYVMITHYNNGPDGFLHQLETHPIDVFEKPGQRRLAAADFNGDQEIDFAITDVTSSDLFFYFNKQGEFTTSKSPIEIGVDNEFVVAEDLDGDGDVDILTNDADHPRLLMHLNDGDGNFTPAKKVPTASPPSDVKVDDLNNDGLNDLVTAESESTASIYFNDGANGFLPGPSFSVGKGLSSIVIGDIDNDSDNDVLLGHSITNNVVILRNTATGFVPEDSAFVSLLPIESLFIGDLDQDADLDLVMIAGSESTTLINDGTGNFSRGIELPFVSGSAVLADLDSDRDLDLVDYGSLGFRQFLNDGTGQFSFSTFNFAARVNAFFVEDIDGDTDRDIVATNSVTNLLLVSRNDCIRLGDINNDGRLNRQDIDSFVELLLKPQYQIEADVNLDGRVDLLDITPFVLLLGQ